MRPSRSKTSSSASDEAKFDAEHNSNGREQQIESPSRKLITKNLQAKRQRDESDENPKATPSKMPKRASGVDLEELLAQTYPKEASYTPAADEEVRRSRRSKQRPAKSADSVKKWSGNDEICVARALLESCSPSGEPNMNVFYQRAKEDLHKEISNSQLYDKVRSMNRRFRSIQSKLQEQNITEESFSFRTPQEPELFQLWKQIWGKNNSISPNEGRIARDGNLSEAENPREIKFENKSDDEHAAAEESTGDQRHHEEEEPQQQNLQKNSPPPPPQTLAENLNKTASCEGKGLQNIVKNVLESTEQRIEALIQSRLQASSGGGCACSVLSRRMKEMMDAVNFVEEFRGLSGPQAKELQQKWRRHRIQELKMLGECFGLLHGQCKAFLENLDN